MALRCSVTSRIKLVGDGVSYVRPSAASKVVYPVGCDDSGSVFLESTSVVNRSQSRVPYVDDYKVF